ncbi:MAG TPA: hypothetical protein VLT33_32755 [Labilithrix sp.]|nr:hypothetical protein [Labilithrix sp.]
MVILAKPGAIPQRVGLAIMAVQVAVGLAGFVLHVAADLRGSAAALLDRFVFGAPPFAPMLFADLALLAAIGLWASAPERSPRSEEYWHAR